MTRSTLGLAFATLLAWSAAFALPPSIRSAEAQDPNVKPVHGMAMHGAPKYGPDFKHFDYANPDAPKGGSVVYAGIGSFDSFNPYTLQGDYGVGASYETLTTQSLDEPFSEYGLIAESMEVPEDRSWVIFNLRKEAHFHDGTPITADDVVFSFNILKEKGPPFYQSYYSSVAKAEKLGDLKVKFSFAPGDNRELPLILGQLPVLPQHLWKDKDITQPSLDVPEGSGPYKIAKYEAGRSITLERVKDYWGKDLAVNVGQNNFDTIRYDFYRDQTVSLEAFKAGTFDINLESSAKNWATAYEIPAVFDGRIIKEKIPTEGRNLMQGFVYNLRKPMFQDRKVREALAYAFDFEWSNKALFYGQYVRIRSYFGPSELGSTGTPSPEELKILDPYKGKIPDEVFTTEYNPPKTDGSGDARANLETASKILDDAGWKIENGVRTKDGLKLEFEILLNQPTFERVTQPFIQNLAQIGVKATMRTVDPAQYQKRMDQFDYDMTVDLVGQSLSPGNEQREFWTTKSADTNGSRNLAGIKDPVVDELVEKIIAAKDRDDLVTSARALDRVLQWGFYYIPHWNAPFDRVAYWNRFSHPSNMPPYGLTLSTWWVDAEKEAALQQKKTTAPADAQQAPAPATPAPTDQAPTSQAPAAPAPAPASAEPATPPDTRGSTPIPYILGGIALAIIAFVLVRRGRRK
ncbi:extracellular solute-binding protein [Dongia sp.]|uniref:extracellular solute-binding protein n=1 Tax=Dongia sp. TaxID=1977262 RepID=UPI003753CA1C